MLLTGPSGSGPQEELLFVSGELLLLLHIPILLLSPSFIPFFRRFFFYTISLASFPAHPLLLLPLLLFYCLLPMNNCAMLLLCFVVEEGLSNLFSGD